MTRSLRSGRPGLALVVALLLVVTAAAPAGASTVAAGADDPDRLRPAGADPSTVYQQQTTPTPANNSTVRHEDPDESGSEGNLTDLRRWLAGRMDDALVDCAQLVRVESGEACEVLSEEFPSLSSRYSEVARSTENPSDDNVNRVLNRTADRQHEFVRTVREYRATLAAYREARRENDAQRARDLARELSRQADRVVRLGGLLSVHYDVILGNGTMAVSPAKNVTENVTANVSERTEQIRAAEFDPPELTVSSNVSTVSFVDPASVRGRLRADNGTPLANRPVAVSVANRTLRTRTDADGAFEVTYRPTTAPTGPTTVVAQYLPRDGSEHTTTQAETELSVEATEATVEFQLASPSPLAFGDEVRVGGTVSVDGTAVSGVPVVVSVGGVEFHETATDESGSFSLSEPLPASVPSGSRTVDVSLAREGRAVTADPASTTVRVEETSPKLSVRAERVDPDTVHLRGLLSAADTPISGAELLIRRGNETVATVRTSDEDVFEADVPLPDVGANESVALTVAYDPPDGNLAPVETRIDVGPAPNAGGPDSNVDTGFDRGPLGRIDPTVLGFGTLAALLLLLVASGVAYRSPRPTGGSGRSTRRLLERVGRALVGRRAEPDSERGDEPAIPDSARERLNDSPEESDAVTVLLEAAESQLRKERADSVVVTAYTAVRRRLDVRFDVDPTLTHWELLALYRDSLDEESRAALERLTEAYEQAVFSSAESTPETANTALESAGVIVGRTRPSDAEPSSADD